MLIPTIPIQINQNFPLFHCIAYHHLGIPTIIPPAPTSTSQSMMNSFRTCLSSLHRRARIFLQQPRNMERVCKSNSRKNKGLLSSSFDLPNYSFAAMEMSNQFKQVFNVIDANGDGKISCSELSEVLRCLGYEKSKAASEAERMVRVMDCNGDGAIDLDEFISAVNDDGNFGSGNKEDYLMDVFLIFDTDKNGVISARELQTVLISLGCKNAALKIAGV